MKASDYAIRALYNETTGETNGWEIVLIKQQHGDACFGVSVGQVHVPFMGASSGTILQYIVSSWVDQENEKRATQRLAETASAQHSPLQE